VLLAGAVVALGGGLENSIADNSGQGTVDTGVAMVVGGLAGIAVGIPLTVIGNRKVPARAVAGDAHRRGAWPAATWSF
jgi:hypothetical protein